MRRISGMVLAAGLAAASGSWAVAADLAAYKAPRAAAFDWSGLYVGTNAGYGWLDAGGTSLKGIIGGGQMGANWQTGNFVLGLETDLQATGQKAMTTTTAAGVTVTETDKLSWLGTTRLRAGFAADRWLVYGTGGVAYGQIKEDGTVSGGLVGTYSGSNTKVGWTLGGGVEAAIDRNWSWKVEYLYARFSGFTNTYSLPGATLTVAYPAASETIVRAGVNYRF